MSELLNLAAIVHPDGYFSSRLISRGLILNWRELDDEVTRRATRVSEEWPIIGTRIGLWGTNSLDYLIALFSIIRSGRVAVPISTHLTSHELEDLADAVSLGGMITTRDFPASHRAVVSPLPIQAMASRVPGREVAGAIGGVPYDHGGSAVIICSSGSEGKVKAAPLTLGSLLEHARAVCSHLRVRARDHWLACLPFHHVGGLTIAFRCMVAGASITIIERADAEEMSALIEAGDITLISVVPTLLANLLHQRRGRAFPPSLRAIIVGGGPVADELVTHCPPALPTYGLTEAGSMVTCARPGCDEAERHSAGVPLPGTQLRIEGENGKALGVDEEGEIVVHGPGMSGGYVGHGNGAQRTFHGGWIHTGDIGYVDPLGCLHVLARRTDLILRGGENVYPAEIEAVLREHEAIAAVVVVPVPDPVWGQVPGAVIVSRKGCPLTIHEIEEFAATRLARYKLPRHIQFVSEIPLLPNGKPNLPAIREMFNSE